MKRTGFCFGACRGAALGAVLSLAMTGAGLAQDDRRSVLLAQSDSNPFTALVGERRERSVDRHGHAKVERYVLASDNRALLIQARTRTARVKFLCGPNDPRLDCRLDPENPSAEIYLLTVTRGPRGDVIFKDASGETLLRLASYGGATVFWPGEGRGFAASKSFGDDADLQLGPASRQAARTRAKSATAIISALTGAPITFDITATGDGDDAVLADAILRTAIGMNAVASDQTGASALAKRLSRVVFDIGSAPGLQVEESVLKVTYVPDQDIAGRPSSRAVERFLEDSL